VTLLLTGPGKPGKGAGDTARDIVEALGENKIKRGLKP